MHGVSWRNDVHFEDEAGYGQMGELPRVAAVAELYLEYLQGPSGVQVGHWEGTFL